MSEVAPFLLVIGRILIGVLFLVAGMRQALVVPALAGDAPPASRPVRLAASGFQIVGGACLILGIEVAWVALALVAFTLGGSAVTLNFWNKTGWERERLSSLWLPNLAIVGGLLLAAVQAM